MGIFEKHFPLGLGTSRFPVKGPDDYKGIKESVKIVRHALENGIDYIDVSYNYSAGMTPFVLREAFNKIKRPFSVAAKVGYSYDKTADDARKRIEVYLKTLGLGHISYFTCWCIWSFDEFQKIMAKGGVYEGALKLKDEGIIDHICCSLHAHPEDMIRIIESGAFEGITVSYSLMNTKRMIPVLDAAKQNNVSVAVMNPLGGGIIAQNQKFFSFACGEYDDGNTIHAALRFVYAHPAVDIVLSGAGSEEEILDSLSVFKSDSLESPDERFSRVMSNASELKGFCTGCRYCEGCPQGIPTADIMQARNILLFDPVEGYNRCSPEKLLYNLQIMRKLHFDNSWLPDSMDNPCVKCGRCEKACTQKLNIIDGVADIYHRIAETGYSKKAHINRLQELFVNKGYRKVGLYPSGGYVSKIINLYNDSFGEPDFEWLLFDSNQNMWGQNVSGLPVHAPIDISLLHPDIIIIDTYRFDIEIEESLKLYSEEGIRIEKLHKEQDVPWVF